MLVNLQKQNGFLTTVGMHPCRFAMAACALSVCFVCGASSNVYVHDERFIMYLLSASTPDSVIFTVRTLLCALCWQTLLTYAVYCGRRTGIVLLSALIAFCIEGFTYGFAVSELLFYYGEKGAAFLLIETALCGAAGIALRLFLFLREDQPAHTGIHSVYSRTENRMPARIRRKLIILTFLQGCAAPLLFSLGD